MAKPKNRTTKRRRRIVWAVSWETSGICGSDSHEAKEWDGWYTVAAYYGNPRSRYKTLREAVRACDLGCLPDKGVRMEVTCPVLSPAEMAQLLDPANAEYGDAVLLNGEVWVYDTPGIMRPAATEAEWDRVLVDL
jgi:hypothetical protein